MPTYEITDPETGRKIRVTGDTPPTEAELNQIFASVQQAPAPVPRVVQQEPTDPSFMQQAGGVVENLASLATGAVAEPIAGLAGLAAAAIPGGRTGAEQVEATRQALTYQPRTAAGQQQQQALGEALQPVGETIQAVEQGAGDFAFDLTGSPTVAALASAAPAAALELIGLKGASKLRGAKQIAGIPDDIADELAKQGVDLDNLPDEVISQIQTGVDPRNAIQQQRAQLFQELDIPTLRSRITQEQGDFLLERKLKRQVGVPEAEEITKRQLEESASFERVTRNLVDQLGVPEEAGDLIKNALAERLTGEKAATRELYKQLGEKSSGVGVPLQGGEIWAALDADNIRSMAGRLDPTERRQINDILIEFGIDTDPDRVQAFLNRQSDDALPSPRYIRPLNVLNSEDMNQALNAISDPTASAQMRGVVGAIKKGLEKELDVLDDALQGVDGDVAKQTQEIREAAKRARAQAREVFTEYSPKKLVGKLTSKVRGSNDVDQILASEVVNKMLGKSRDGSIESISQVVDSLNKAGESGVKGLRALRGAVVADALNRAVSNQGRQFNPAAFSKRLDQIGRDKIAKIFEGDQQALQQLNRIEEAGRLTNVPEAVARASGTADDIFNRLERIPFFRPFVVAGGGATGLIAAEGVQSAGQQLRKRSVRKKVRQQLDNSVELRKMYNQNMRLYPDLMIALGIGSVMTNESEEDATNN